METYDGLYREAIEARFKVTLSNVRFLTERVRNMVVMAFEQHEINEVQRDYLYGILNGKIIPPPDEGFPHYPE